MCTVDTLVDIRLDSNINNNETLERTTSPLEDFNRCQRSTGWPKKLHKILLISLQAMFNMSSSFLDDTLRSAAPLTENGQYYFYNVV